MLHQSARAVTRRSQPVRLFNVKPQIDIKHILQHLPAVRENVVRRGLELDLTDFAALHHQHASALQAANSVRQERNLVAAQMKSKQLDKADRSLLISQGKQLKEELAKLDETRLALWDKLSQIAEQVPNSTDSAAPDEEKVVEIIGTPLKGPNILSHEHIAANLGIADFEAASRVVGSKFVYLRGAAAMLEMALQHWAMQEVSRHGFEPVITPDLARSSVVEGCGFQPRGEHTQVYSIEDSKLCLVGTAEIALAGLVSDNVIAQEALPLRLVGLSHCFRTEAGAAGAAEKGLYRLHQFTKVEMFVVSEPHKSDEALELIVEIQRSILQKLGLCFRVLDMPPHELGASASRKFDMECWMPGRSDWGEVSSASNCTDYQARRLGVKMNGPDGRVFAHTLNGTAVAIPRLILSILETYQNPDGSVEVPAVLQPLMGISKIEASTKN